MPLFEVEQYEIHTVKRRVQAATISEAIAAVLAGQGDLVDNSQEYVEIADTLGMPADDNRDIVEGLALLGIDCEDVIPSIRDVEEVEDDGDAAPAV